MKRNNIESVSHKSIMFMIYLRTLLELSIEYDKDGNIIGNSLTTTANQIYRQICNIEKTIYNKSMKLREKYLEAHDLTKKVWKKSVDSFDSNYQIYLEPIIATLYTQNEHELKHIGLNPTLFMRMYDNYYVTSNCELEVQSVKPVDVIVKETEKALFEFKKEQKRNRNEPKSEAISETID